jgi:hypothetical protein
MPGWVHPIAVAWLSLAGACALIIVADLLAGHPQHMAIMNIVWPVTALYAGPLAVLGYFTAGRLSTQQAVAHAKRRGEAPPGTRKPMWQVVALSATHCGSGCTLGDLAAEGLVVLVPITIFHEHLFGTWAVGYAFAFLFGIAFQFFTIAPMRRLGVREGLIEAVKADALSLTAWQVGMYGWMAVVVFAFVGHELRKTDPAFWFMMQIAMLVGFFTSYPVNWWLVRSGLKERM